MVLQASLLLTIHGTDGALAVADTVTLALRGCPMVVATVQAAAEWGLFSIDPVDVSHGGMMAA